MLDRFEDMLGMGVSFSRFSISTRLVHLTTQPILVGISHRVKLVFRIDAQRNGLIPVMPNWPPNLRQYNDFVSGDVVLLDGFAEHDFRKAITVHVGGIKRVDAEVVGCFDMFDA